MKTDGIAIIGRVADGVELLDGQTVKTRILREELQRFFPQSQLICADTYHYRERMLSVLWNTIRAFLCCEHIFILLSKNGRRFFFPLLTCLNALFHRRLYHDVIGGALPDEVRTHPSLCRQLNRFEVNWVEVPAMKDALTALGVCNVERLPNFKRLDLLDEGELPQITKEPFVFTTFSRITKEKGITEAVKAVTEINRRAGRHQAELHVYGQVEDAFKEEFDTLLGQHPDSVLYKGCVAYEKSVAALCNSFMLLFPSTYPGEGLPGTIIDAFSAGVPVIATDWHFNGELVRNGETGYCYSWERPEQLIQWMLYAMSHPDEVNAMRPACLREARLYTPEAAMEQILKKMQQPCQKEKK